MARAPKPSGRKKKSRPLSSYKRRYGNLQVGECILIVCEGARTEPNYFHDLRKRYRLTTIEVVIYGDECGSAPISVVDYAIKKKNERDELVRRQSTLPEFQSVWCVFETENPLKNPSFMRAIDKASRTGFLELAVSNPAFEYWYLLHFTNTSRSFADAADVIRSLKQYIEDYEKNFEQHDRLFNHTQTAIDRAKRILHDRVDDCFAPNPSTRVFVLVEKLRNMAR